MKTLPLDAVMEAFNPKIVLELPIRRAGQEGCVSDNPPIEEIDPLLSGPREAQFGALRIPVDLDQPENRIGEEISAIDGWADLASYADIALVRLFLLHTEFIESPHIEHMLKEILHYLNDMDISSSLRLPISMISNLPEYLDKILRNPEFPCGLDIPINLNASEAPQPADSPIIQTLSAALPESYTADDLCDWFGKIHAHASESVKAIVFEIP
ncbi:MAG: hypothetical protein JXR73_09890 [Candidatus Omnitrophica bacterium]|nr:hypothetical protein [Candidatus Omnitrophota bacterium]